MANIRIKDLSTTAASTASDDFIAVDGATNGTRKLNAYSPTFGGNLTVSGTGNNQIGGSGAKVGLGTSPNASAGTYIKNSSGYTLLVDTGRTDAGTTGIFLRDNAGSVRGWVGFDPTGTTLQISGNGGGTVIGDNLTVSGGTITGGTSGLSLAAGGTNQSITLTPSGTGRSNAYGSIPSSAWAANDLDSSFNAGLVVGPRGTGSSFGVSTASAASGYPSGMLVDGSYSAPNSTVNIKAVGVYSGGGYGASLAFHTSSNTTLSEAGRFTKAGNLLIGTTTDTGEKLQVSGTAAITGALSIGNTVQTAVSVASTHKVTISIGGSTYYLLATNV